VQTIRLRVWQLVLAVGLATLLLGVALGHFLLPGKPRGREIDLGDGVKVYVSKSAEPQLEARRDSSEAMTNVRAAIPAIEAYAADHNGYARMTLAAVRKYDAAIPAALHIVSATRSGYCVESTVAKQTYSKDGPAAELVPRACPGG